MMSKRLVTEQGDRWIINARSSVVREVAASPGGLRIELDSGLWVEVEGGWTASRGSPITGEGLQPEEVAGLVGSGVLSLVLFATGSIRIVLSPGVTIVAKAFDADRIAAGMPNHLTWESDGRSLTKWHSRTGDDG